MQLNLTFFDPPDPLGGTLSESLWEQLDEPARRTALEILACSAVSASLRIA